MRIKKAGELSFALLSTSKVVITSSLHSINLLSERTGGRQVYSCLFWGKFY